MKESAEVKKRIGVLFGGETGLYDRLTARENLEYFGKLYGLDQHEIKARIEDLAKAFWHETIYGSKGERILKRNETKGGDCQNLDP